MSILQAIGLTVLPHCGPILTGQLFGWTKNIKTFSKKLKKPSYNPPYWVFAPVWAYLFTSMGYASYMILRDGEGHSQKVALGLYGSQLLLNWAWTPIYFGYHKLGLALIDILLMTANVAACIPAFYSINKTAAYLMVPYLAWLSLASYLSVRTWQLNKDRKDFN